jgi:hypothetical protein
MPPCCELVEGGSHPPDARDDDQRVPIVIGVEVRRPDEQALEAAVQLPIPTEAALVNAIGVPLEERTGVSEPAFRPAPVLQGAEIDGPPCCTTWEREPAPVIGVRNWLRSAEENAVAVIALFTLLLAIGFWLVWRRRRPALEPEPLPVTRPTPGDLPWPDTAPVPTFEPEVALAMAMAREAQRELA